MPDEAKIQDVDVPMGEEAKKKAEMVDEMIKNVQAEGLLRPSSPEPEEEEVPNPHLVGSTGVKVTADQVVVDTSKVGPIGGKPRPTAELIPDPADEAELTKKAEEIFGKLSDEIPPIQIQTDFSARDALDAIERAVSSIVIQFPPGDTPRVVIKGFPTPRMVKLGIRAILHEYPAEQRRVAKLFMRLFPMARDFTDLDVVEVREEKEDA